VNELIKKLKKRKFKRKRGRVTGSTSYDSSWV
jgi:hypothetical protein